MPRVCPRIPWCARPAASGSGTCSRFLVWSATKSQLQSSPGRLALRRSEVASPTRFIHRCFLLTSRPSSRRLGVDFEALPQFEPISRHENDAYATYRDSLGHAARMNLYRALYHELTIEYIKFPRNVNRFAFFGIEKGSF